jgi:hypothetical protein
VAAEERRVARHEPVRIGQLAVRAHLGARVVEERAAHAAVFQVCDRAGGGDLVELAIHQAGKVELELDAHVLQSSTHHSVP